MTPREPWTPPVPPLWGNTLSVGFEPHFLGPLKFWFREYIPFDTLTVVGLKAHLDWTRFSGLRDQDINKFVDAMFSRTDTEILLALDAALYELGPPSRYRIPGAKPEAADALNEMLEAGGSAWRVRNDGCGLERRVLEAVRVAVEGAISSARATSADASDHLANAWRHAYGISPDATSAYGEAIRAVESASARLVEPHNAKATLGSINGAVRSNPGAWEVAITDPTGSKVDGAPVLYMMELLWRGQTDRHGANPTVPVTLAAAQAAVHLAAMLVQWWTSGGVAKI